MLRYTRFGYTWLFHHKNLFFFTRKKFFSTSSYYLLLGVILCLKNLHKSSYFLKCNLHFTKYSWDQFLIIRYNHLIYMITRDTFFFSLLKNWYAMRYDEAISREQLFIIISQTFFFLFSFFFFFSSFQITFSLFMGSWINEQRWWKFVNVVNSMCNYRGRRA